MAGPEDPFLPEPTLTLHINQTPMSTKLATVQQPTWEDVIIAVCPDLPDQFSFTELLRHALSRFPKLCLRTPEVEDVLRETADRVLRHSEEPVSRSPKKVTG